MSARKGFTLVELLVAMTVFSVVMTAVYTAFHTGARVWRYGEENMQMFQDARVALTLVSRELRCAFPEAGHLFYGEDDRSGDKDNDRIEFFAVRPPLQPGKGQEARILRIAYHIDQARGGRGYVLKRQEQIVTGQIPTKQEVAKLGKKEKRIKMESPWRCVLATNVDSLDFRYMWKRDWVPYCKRGFGLPAVIEVALTLRGADKRSDTTQFVTAVRIPLGHGEGPPREEQIWRFETKRI